MLFRSNENVDMSIISKVSKDYQIELTRTIDPTISHKKNPPVANMVTKTSKNTESKSNFKNFNLTSSNGTDKKIKISQLLNFQKLSKKGLISSKRLVNPTIAPPNDHEK